MTIYFIRKGMEGPIKIGYTSSSAEKRMAQLQTGHHEKLHLIGTIKGQLPDEHAIHKELASYRIHGEWFDPKPELLVVIGEAIANQFDWYYLRKIKATRIDVECKGLTVLVSELRQTISQLERRIEEMRQPSPKIRKAFERFRKENDRLRKENEELKAHLSH